jgi:hypothetical protein
MPITGLRDILRRRQIVARKRPDLESRQQFDHEPHDLAHADTDGEAFGHSDGQPHADSRPDRHAVANVATFESDLARVLRNSHHPKRWRDRVGNGKQWVHRL